MHNCLESKPYIFISYSSHDAEIVRKDVEELSSRGVNIWFDEELNKAIGEKWDDKVLWAMKNPRCKACFLYVSEYSLTSNACRKELFFTKSDLVKKTHAKKAIPIYPIELENINDIAEWIQVELVDKYYSSEQPDLENDILPPYENATEIGDEFFPDNSVKRFKFSTVHDDAFYEQLYFSISEQLPEVINRDDLIVEAKKETVLKEELQKKELDEALLAAKAIKEQAEREAEALRQKVLEDAKREAEKLLKSVKEREVKSIPLTAEEPAAEEPAAEEPAAEEPATEEPATEKPAAKKQAPEVPLKETECPVIHADNNPALPDLYAKMTGVLAAKAMMDQAEFEAEALKSEASEASKEETEKAQTTAAEQVAGVSPKETEHTALHIDKNQVLSDLRAKIAAVNSSYYTPLTVPDKVWKGAVAKYLFDCPRSELIALKDSSLLGNGKSGVAVSTKAVYVKETFAKGTFAYKDIDYFVPDSKNSSYFFSFEANNTMQRCFLNTDGMEYAKIFNLAKAALYLIENKQEYKFDIFERIPKAFYKWTNNWDTDMSSIFGAKINSSKKSRAFYHAADIPDELWNKVKAVCDPAIARKEDLLFLLDYGEAEMKGLAVTADGLYSLGKASVYGTLLFDEDVYIFQAQSNSYDKALLKKDGTLFHVSDHEPDARSTRSIYLALRAYFLARGIIAE